MTSFKYLECTIEQKECVLNKYERTVESVKEDIEAIQLWLEKQPHIPRDFEGHHIEHFLVANKFIFNKVKKTIDWYYRIRYIYPDYIKDPDENSMVTILNQFYFFPLPKMTSSNSRVIILKMRNIILDKNMDVCSLIAYAINIADFIINHDIPCAKVFVIDFTDIKVDFCIKFTPVIFKTIITIFEKAYRNGVVGIHLLHLPAVLEIFCNLFKSLLSPKVVQRLQIHKNFSSLFEVISQEIFPKDYGGGEISFEELHELWKNELTQNLPIFKRRQTLVTDESLRTEELDDCDLMGFQGNFRKLNLD